MALIRGNERLLYLTNNITNHHMEEWHVTYYLDLKVLQCFRFVFPDVTFTVWDGSVTCFMIFI